MSDRYFFDVLLRHFCRLLRCKHPRGKIRRYSQHRSEKGKTYLYNNQRFEDDHFEQNFGQTLCLDSQRDIVLLKEEFLCILLRLSLRLCLLL